MYTGITSRTSSFSTRRSRSDFFFTAQARLVESTRPDLGFSIKRWALTVQACREAERRSAFLEKPGGPAPGWIRIPVTRIPWMNPGDQGGATGFNHPLAQQTRTTLAGKTYETLKARCVERFPSELEGAFSTGRTSFWREKPFRQPSFRICVSWRLRTTAMPQDDRKSRRRRGPRT